MPQRLSDVSACFVVYALFAYFHGTMETSDGDRDAGYALNLIQVGFNPVAYLETVDMPQPGIQYLIYIYILAFCHLLGGEHWLSVLTVIDVVAYGTAAYLILTIAVWVTRSLAGVTTVFLSLILGFEYYQWIPLAQSDSIFVLVVVACFYFVLRAWTMTTASAARKNLLIAVGVGAVAFFFRPTSPALFGFIIAALLLRCFSQSVSPSALRLCMLALGAVGVVIMAVIIMIVAVLTQDPSLLPPSKVRDVLVLHREYYLEGAVVLFRPETFIAVSDSVWGFATVSILRLYYFFYFVADDFSFYHTVWNVAFSIPLYGVALVGLGAGLFSKYSTDQNVPIVAAFLSLALIVLFDVYHAVTILDYNWRYRAPAYPAIFILAGQGTAFISRSYLQRFAATDR